MRWIIFIAGILSLLPEWGHAADPEAWIPGKRNNIYDATYGGGRFVAVGQFGDVLWSDDGSHWWGGSGDGYATAGHFYGVCYGGGQFVTVGHSGRIARSADGKTWTAVPSPATTDLYDVAWDGTKYIAVGDQKWIYSSTDGVTWTGSIYSDPVGPAFNDLTNIRHGGGIWVATFNNSPMMLRSTDGVTWAQVDSGVSHSFKDLIFANGKFICAGGTGVSTSTDGMTWNSIVAATESLESIACSGTTCVAVSNEGDLWTSTDLVSWSETGTSDTLTTVAAGNGMFSALGEVHVAASADGQSWNVNRTSAGEMLESACWHQGSLVVVGPSGLLGRYDLNDHSFQQGTTPFGTTPHFKDVASNGNACIAIEGFTIARSTDGLVWTDVSPASLPYLLQVEVVNGKFVAVGQGGKIAVSNDGISWQITTIPDTPTLNGIASNGTTTMICGTDGNLVSNDLLSWTPKPDPPFTFADIAYGNGTFVGFWIGFLYTSPDGNAWTLRHDHGRWLEELTFLDGQFVAIQQGEGGVISSVDGVTWVDDATGIEESGVLKDATSADGTTVVVGYSGSILTSRPFIPAPANLTATDGAFPDKVTVSWDVVAGASSYQIYRSTTDDSSTATMVASSVAGTTWDDVTATVGVVNYYWVKTVASAGVSGFSGSDSGHKLDVPAPPANLTATDGTYEDKVTVNWNPSGGAASYEVYRNTEDNSSTATMVASSVGGTSWDDTGVTPAVTYHYWVKASNAAGESGFSAGDSGFAKIVAGPPAGVDASDGTFSEKVEVSWNAAPNAEGYRVYRAPLPAGNPFTSLGNVPGGTTAFDDTGAAIGAQYQYRVISWTATGGESAPGVDDSGHRAIPVPGNVSATLGLHQGEVQITWDAVSGGFEYQISRGTEADGSDASLVGTTNATDFTDTTGTLGESYYYFVRTKASSLTSEQSAGDIGYGTVEPPFRPDGLIGKFRAVLKGNNIYVPGKAQEVKLVSRRLKKLIWTIEIQNDGETADQLIGRLNRGNRFFRSQLRTSSGANETAAANSGRLLMNLDGESSTERRLEIKPTRRAKHKVKRKTFLMWLQSANKSEMKDRVSARAKTKR